MLEAAIWCNMGDSGGHILVNKQRDDGEVHYEVSIEADLSEAAVSDLINRLIEIRDADTLIEEPETAQAG